MIGHQGWAKVEKKISFDTVALDSATDLPSFDLAGRYSLFSAHRKADAKMGQLVTFELEGDQQRFERLFVPV